MSLIKMRLSTCCLLPALCLLLASSTYASSLSKDREVYQQALTAIQNNQLNAIISAREKLADYPLLPYLEYSWLEKQFADLPADAVRNFLEQHQGSYIARRLQISWLNYLGQERQWHLFNDFHEPDTATRSHQCYHLESRLEQNPDSAAAIYTQTGLLWLQPFSLPAACDRLFEQWRSQGHPSHDLAWQRFQAAYAANRLQLARYLLRYLSTEQKKTAEHILDAGNHAQYWLARLSTPQQVNDLQLDSATRKRLLRIVSRSHYREVAQLLQAQPRLLKHEDLLELQQVTAWHLARQSGDEANQWLSQINTENHPELIEQQLRYAMQDRNWLQYQRLFTQHAEHISDKDEWLYWHAIAQEQTGMLDNNHYFTPQAIYRRLAQRRSFYGFLAAENQQALPAISQNPSLALQVPAKNSHIRQKLRPALELFAINELAEANREWHYVSRDFDESEWQQAGLLAHKAQWHDRSIHALARAGMWDAIDERFPLAYQELFYQYSRKNDLDQGWLLAMARQESGFSARAQSPVGAIGVLQLMPATARQLARQNKTTFSHSSLFSPEYNIALGSQYLKNMLNRFDNNYILATAAYNAGPARVNQWLQEQPMTDDWVHWVATIPFPETRNYVKNILTYSRIYQSRLGSDLQISLAGQPSPALPESL